MTFCLVRIKRGCRGSLFLRSAIFIHTFNNACTKFQCPVWQESAKKENDNSKSSQPEWFKFACTMLRNYQPDCIHLGIFLKPCFRCTSCFSHCLYCAHLTPTEAKVMRPCCQPLQEWITWLHSLGRGAWSRSHITDTFVLASLRLPTAMISARSCETITLEVVNILQQPFLNPTHYPKHWSYSMFSILLEFVLHTSPVSYLLVAARLASNTLKVIDYM